jgi:hypothetical protein
MFFGFVGDNGRNWELKRLLRKFLGGVADDFDIRVLVVV